MSLENQAIIEEKDLTDYYNSGIILVEIIESYLIIGFLAFLNSTVFSVYNFLNNNECSIFPAESRISLIKIPKNL